MRKGIESPAAYLGFYGGFALFAGTMTFAAFGLWAIAIISMFAMVATFGLWAWALVR